jgi:hypothetical protein
VKEARFKEFVVSLGINESMHGKTRVKKPLKIA